MPKLTKKQKKVLQTMEQEKLYLFYAYSYTEKNWASYLADRFNKNQITVNLKTARSLMHFNYPRLLLEFKVLETRDEYTNKVNRRAFQLNSIYSQLWSE